MSNAILLVEDDPVIQKTVGMSLKYAGYEVSSAMTLKQARAMIAEHSYSIILLDINLPDGNGADFCKDIRSDGNEVPILFLSAQVDEETIVKSMKLGGDDYLRKPFGQEELKVRIARLIERFPFKTSVSVAGPISIDSAKHVAFLNGEELDLGRKEFQILLALVKKKGEVITRENVMNAVGEDNEIFDRTIDSHMSHLRKKLKSAEAVKIQSVYGVGYRLEWK